MSKFGSGSFIIMGHGEDDALVASINAEQSGLFDAEAQAFEKTLSGEFKYYRISRIIRDSREPKVLIPKVDPFKIMVNNENSD